MQYKGGAKASQALQALRAAKAASHPRISVGFSVKDWMGFSPGLPEPIFGARAWVEGSRGLRIGAHTDGGAGLTHDVGFKQVDNATLPLNDTGNPSAAGDPIVRMQTMFRVDEDGEIGADSNEAAQYDLTLLAMTSGDGSTAGSAALHRLVPGTGTWDECDYIARTAYTGATAMSANRDGAAPDMSMPDTAVFPAGAPSHDPRDASGGVGTTLGLPVTIICNNLNPVYVFPADEHGGGGGNANRHKYTELHAGTLEPFHAKGCFAWEGRMFYGGTNEASVGHPQRIRWSALFDASPDNTIVGAGFVDIRELQGRFLRFENLDPFLVAYFTDGIVFLERTGLVSSPVRQRVVTDHRGALGPHAISHISPREHFVIATDGFYILNASGEFRELGITLEGEVRFRKWHDYFFANLAGEKSHRIQCWYDQLCNCVRISWPNGSTGKQMLWSYDIRNDWMIVESWDEAQEVLCFADHSDALRTAMAWDSSAAPTTWEDTTSDGGVTWSSGAAGFKRSNLFHGTIDGLVHVHDNEETLFDGTAQSWALVTGRQPSGDVRTHTCWEAMQTEIVDLGNTANLNMMLEVQDMLGGKSMLTVTEAMSVDGTNTGNLYLRSMYSRLGGSYVRINLSGNGLVGIRQVFLDVRLSESRIR